MHDNKHELLFVDCCCHKRSIHVVAMSIVVLQYDYYLLDCA